MNTFLVIATLVLGAGIYLEYQKDSSFASVDTGSLVIGVGVGLFAGHFLG